VQPNFRQLPTLCTHLNCTPNDLLALRDMNLPTAHELQKLQQFDDTPLPSIENFWQTKACQKCENS